MAITHAQRKFIRELQQRSARRKYGAFVVEGTVNVAELLQSSCVVDVVVGTDEALSAFRQNPVHRRTLSGREVEVTSPADFARISSQVNPSGILAVARTPDHPLATIAGARRILYLDRLNDPGNAGTLIRSAEWFGVDAVCASPEGVDWYNPKTVAAARGSLFRVPHLQVELQELLAATGQPPLLIADLVGTPSREFAWPAAGVLLIGSESHGPGPEARARLQAGIYRTEAVTISGAGRPTESLNAAVAGSLLLADWWG